VEDARGVERRTIQLGLRCDFLRRYGREWILAVKDISRFVEEQRAHVRAGGLGELVTPAEEVYPVADAAVAACLGVATTTDSGAPAGTTRHAFRAPSVRRRR
jgi:hypothetical protein